MPTSAGSGWRGTPRAASWRARESELSLGGGQSEHPL